MDLSSLLAFSALLILVMLVTRRLVSTTGGKILEQKLAAGATVVDVRSPGEFATGNFLGSINLPLDSLSGQLSRLGSKDRPIILYCATGARSAAAMRILRAAGYLDVSNAGSLRRLAQLAPGR